MSFLRPAAGVVAISFWLLAVSEASAQLNETCTVSILNRSTQVRPNGTWIVTNIPVGQGRVRARAVCTFNGVTRFGQSDLFIVPPNGSVTLTPIIFGPITPIASSLLLTAPTTNLDRTGATTQLTVTARYPDGSTADVTSSAAGTTYTSSNPAVATVSTGGLVTAVASGTALMSAFNEGTSGSISIRVGIPPTVTITSPLPASTVTEGATIPVSATATGTVAFVKFSVNQQVVFTSVRSPYQFNYTVPLAVSSLTFGAQADDGFGNIGTAQAVQINVARDLLTTVLGRVVDSGGNPVAGATVTTVGGRSGTTASDGAFSITNVRTALGDIRVTARFIAPDGTVFTGASAAVPPVPSGTTDVGTITVQQFSGKVLVAGGLVQPDFYADTAEVFDPLTGTWSPTQNRIPNAPPAAAAGLCAPNMALLGNGQALLAGGGCSDFGLTTNAASLYDPASNQWTATRGMSFGRDQFGMVALNTGNALAFAGCSGGCLGPNILGQGFFQVGPSAEVYDFQTSTWRTVASLNTARGNFSSSNLLQPATTLADGRVLACNGSNGVSFSYATCEIYDPVANQWRSAGPLGEGGRHVFAVLQNGRVLTVKSDGLSAILFDPTTGQWQPTGSLLVRQPSASLTLLSNGEVLAAGGTDGTNYLNTAQIYNPTTGTWRATAPMQTARAWHVAIPLPDGRVLIAGGQTTGGVILPSAEIFDPATRSWSPTGSMSQGRAFGNAVFIPVTGR